MVDSIILPVFMFLAMVVTYLLTATCINRLQNGENSFIALNYKGEKIITAGGIVLLPAALLAAFSFGKGVVTPLLFSIFLVGMALLGLADDLQGDKNCKGFRGHLLLLLQQKKVSTGLLKAVGGVLLALLVLSGGFAPFSLEWLTRGVVLALFANLFNLLDTRPGVVVKAFYIFSLPLFMLAGMGGNIFLIIWASLYVYLPWELSRKIMLGDTGAYLLGALLGFFIVTFLPVSLLYSAFFILLLLHYLLEKYSLRKALTEGIPALRAICNYHIPALRRWGR